MEKRCSPEDAGTKNPLQRAENSLPSPGGHGGPVSEERFTRSSVRVSAGEPLKSRLVKYSPTRPGFPPEAAVTNALLSKISASGTSPRLQFTVALPASRSEIPSR